MNLYQVHVQNEFRGLGYYYVVAKSETGASKLVLKKMEEWDYSTGCWISTIELMAGEGQYGKPLPLLFATV